MARFLSLQLIRMGQFFRFDFPKTSRRTDFLLCYDGNGHVDLRHSVPDVLASTANLLKTNGWQAGAPFTQGTPNFEVAMREWNHSEVYRRTIVLMAQRLSGG